MQGQPVEIGRERIGHDQVGDDRDVALVGRESDAGRDFGADGGLRRRFIPIRGWALGLLGDDRNAHHMNLDCPTEQPPVSGHTAKRAIPRPSLWIGGPEKRKGVLVEHLGAPVALTINAKGVLPPAHPFSLGSSLPLPPVIEALQAADVVLAIGTELGETDTLLFGQALALAGKLIRIDIDAEQMTRNALAAVAICSDAGLEVSTRRSSRMPSTACEATRLRPAGGRGRFRCVPSHR